MLTLCKWKLYFLKEKAQWCAFFYWTGIFTLYTEKVEWTPTIGQTVETNGHFNGLDCTTLFGTAQDRMNIITLGLFTIDYILEFHKSVFKVATLAE